MEQQQQQQQQQEKSWMLRAVGQPATMFEVVGRLLEFVERSGLGRWARRGLFERLRGHLQWARERGDGRVAFLVFLWLYAVDMSVQRAVERVELEAHPWTSQEALCRVREFCKSRVWDLRTTAFLPSNAAALVEAVRRSLLVAVVLRDGHVLEAPEPSPRLCIRKELADVAAQLFPPQQLVAINRTAKRAADIKRAADAIERERTPLPPDAIAVECDEPWLAQIAKRVKA